MSHRGSFKRLGKLSIALGVPFTFVPLLKVRPDSCVVAGDVQCLLPALTIPVEVPPQLPVLDRVCQIQQADSTHGCVHSGHPFTANLFMPDCQGGGGELDTPLAVRVLEVLGCPPGCEADVRQGYRERPAFPPPALPSPLVPTYEARCSQRLASTPGALAMEC